ncbi:MAG: hypothetical protein JST86_15185 [Bacteroidetes bacterium]|nr:hypothetical protein [Bacteroidota bacterium]
MKKVITPLLVLAAVAVKAQTKLYDHAVITTKTTIVSPEGADENAPTPPPGGDGEQRVMFRFGGDGETKSTTTLKGSLIKTFTETDMSRSTTIRDNDKKITTTMLEVMGKKTAFYVTDSDQVQMQKRMDSLMQSRRQNNDNNNVFRNNNTVVGATISYFEDTKKIAGLVCKKALLVTNRQNGNKDTSLVWYCPDFKLKGIVSTGGFGGGGFGGNFGRITTLSGLNDLNGFPMYYEMNMGRGRKMMVEVTKINTEKEVADKEFEIPKDVEVKAMKDMQNGNGGFQFRMGGGPGQ